MSINVNVSIPIDSAIAIRGIDYALERIDGEVEFTLSTITSAVIEAIKDLPDDYLLDGFDADYDFTQPSRSAPRTASRSTSGTTQLSHTTVSTYSTTDSRLGVSFYEDFCITVVDPKGTQHLIETCSDMTVAELEAKLDEQRGEPSKQNRLVWRGYRLNQPDATLRHYGIGPGCVLVLFHHLLPTLPIEDPELENPSIPREEDFDFWLATPSGKSLSVKARPETTTAELATAVWHQLGILPSMQKLVFQGLVVYDGSSYAAGREHLIFTLDEVSIGVDAVVSIQIADSLQ
ncbi:uncharacterized protein MYCFIDRAFT_87951 [Pseudocercospora fijiensis CIRAD86]|uniref:Ubiquitin-like domain-containing protein n=1 Tax=Pseudocercospora fijiensis (strain CIRAD86) TaxID=383855 RepID=M2YPY0_PSEFD|nr:uncharacterized protein MYCFIDRAFT_87951 [Pseudocercospora fijiensis CIRAD86]EME79765.1 hypothetical protein MYCFIDRAFT_87951 [Pseudocercospora fijiensis CIRAD86]